ncbi:hypothetical protein [Aggregatibacter kilianii]|uniref:hypothetical protein n=1 Tax=Aggregatibacter kilianii TaxID=2025884 RepID=UPI0013A61218|nr:hypothetical protein [Aggregatibacter kilianii]
MTEIIPRIRNLVMPRGNDVDVTARVRYRNGTPYDLTGCKLLFVVKRNQSDAEPLLKLTTENGGIMIYDGNLAKIPITRAMTREIPKIVAEYNLHLITADNKFKTVLQGAIEFDPIIE